MQMHSLIATGGGSGVLALTLGHDLNDAAGCHAIAVCRLESTSQRTRGRCQRVEPWLTMDSDTDYPIVPRQLPTPGNAKSPREGRGPSKK